MNDVLCDSRLVAARDAYFERLRALHDNRKPEQVFCLAGIDGVSTADPCKEPEQWVQEAIDSLRPHADALLDPAIFRPLAVEYKLYGVHFIDSIFGAHVYDLDGTGNWQVRMLDTEIGELPVPDLDRSETWQLAKRAARAFLDSGVTVPVFGLTTLSSVLNIALNLYGDRMLEAMYTDPDAVKRDLQIINDLICNLHRWYLANIPLQQLQPVIATRRTQPPGYGQLCGCATQLISPALYEEFIAPHDEALLSIYPSGGMIHLCGTHTQHLPIWRDMKCVTSLQVNDRAAEDLPVYFEGLRDDQIIYVMPFPGMSPKRILEITKGRRTVIMREIPEALLNTTESGLKEGKAS